MATLIVTDTDLWGLHSALVYLLTKTPYFDGENRAWAEAMVEKIADLRDRTGL